MCYLSRIISIIMITWLGSRFWSIVISLFIGHIIYKIINNYTQNIQYTYNQEKPQDIFLYITFQVMGHITKSKGQVTKIDIIHADTLMEKMQLDHMLKNTARNAFRKGKNKHFPLRNILRNLRNACVDRLDLLRLFLEIQVQTAFIDQSFHPNEKKILYIIAEELGININQFKQFLSMVEKGMQFNNQNNFYENNNKDYTETMHTSSCIQDSFKILGVDPLSDEKTIKRAYRKLISKYHPDKLIAKGLSLKKIEIAKKKTQKIQKAYDIIKKSKGFR